MEEHATPGDGTLTQAAEALFRLGRLFSRLSLPTKELSQTARSIELSRILIVQAVETIETRAEGEVTVGAIAQQLAVDPSTASRLVGDAIRDGYLIRTGSVIDSRRVRLEMTEAGRRLAAHARAYQVAIFQHVTRGWTPQERAEFARLFIHFTDAVAASMHNLPNDAAPGSE